MKIDVPNYDSWIDFDTMEIGDHEVTSQYNRKPLLIKRDDENKWLFQHPSTKEWHHTTIIDIESFYINHIAEQRLLDE